MAGEARRARGNAAGSIVCAVVALASFRAEAQQEVRLAPGMSRTVVFAENPSTGYTWAIDAAASQGLDAVVAVADRGYRPGRAMPGAPGKRFWVFKGLKPGQAEIAFVSRRVWEPEPVAAKRVVVDVR